LIGLSFVVATMVRMNTCIVNCWDVAPRVWVDLYRRCLLQDRKTTLQTEDGGRGSSGMLATTHLSAGRHITNGDLQP